MKTKKYLYVVLLFFIVRLLLLNSCTDILEKPVGNEITIDTIFSNRLYVESFLAKVYYDLVPRGFPYTTGNPEPDQYYREFGRSILASISDEGCNTRGATWGWYVNTAGFDPLSSARNQEDGFGVHWIGIRGAYLFIENIDKAPDHEIPPAEKEQMKSECKALIAVRYQEMLKRYGGVPIVRSAFEMSAGSLAQPRNSVQEVVDFIHELTEEVKGVLPNTYPSDKKGRVTSGVALANWSRTALYAASPFFNNGAAAMVLSYEHPEYVCLGNNDRERWRIAAEAADEALKWAKTSGVSLITAADIPGGETDPKNNAYGHATSVKDNREVILANKGYSSSDNGFADGIYWMFVSRGLSVMQSIIYNFRKADGSDQEWPSDFGVRKPFSEYTLKVNEMEPRFYQCCWPVGQGAPNFSATGNYAVWPVSSINESMGSSDMYGACPMVKFHYNYSSSVNMQNWIVFRLAELYLNYAEAANEYYGPTGSVPGGEYTAVEAVNIIRRRGGLRDLTHSEYADVNVFRQQIQRERAVELFAEGHRNFDCRRWKIADDTFGPRLHTLRYVQNADRTAYDYYFLDLHDSRVWTKAMYLYPFPQEEIDKGYLVQNPGY